MDLPYSKPLLTADDYATEDVADLETKLEGRWAEFADGALQQIAHIIEQNDGSGSQLLIRRHNPKEHKCHL